MIPIFEGWNVWTVYQKNDLDFEAMMVGVDRDRRLRIWVEDVAKELPGSDVTDPVALKGSQVQILSAPPTDLQVAMDREHEPGELSLLDGPATLRTVRFFNRGSSGVIPWAHDANYLLEAVYKPSPSSPVTTGPGPEHYMDSPKAVATGALTIIGVGAAALALILLLQYLNDHRVSRG